MHARPTSRLRATSAAVSSLLLVAVSFATEPSTTLSSAELHSVYSSAQDGPERQDGGQGPDLSTLSAEELLRRGRECFAKGEFAAAEPLLDLAVERSGSEFEPRFWRARNRIETGRVNDALDEIDALREAGRNGTEVDYLAGLAFHAKVKQYLAAGADGGTIQMSLEDAVRYLERATAADPARFGDALLPLAEAAWFAQNLELSRDAAERAVAHAPTDPRAHAQLGKTAFSQYQAAKGGEAATEDPGAAHWEAARAAFEASLRLAGEPKAAPLRLLAGESEKQLAFLWAWKKDEERVAEHAARALGWNPAGIEFGWLLSQFAERPRFVETLTRGGELYDAHYGAADPGDATLRWWLGWAQFAEREYEGAEAAFETAVAEWPDYVNSWYYIALARYHQQDFPGAIEALRENWKRAPEDLIASLGSDEAKNLAILDWLVGQAARANDLLAAAELSKMQAETARKEPRYWNNVGLFYRDAGDALMRKKNETERARARAFYEESWSGYSRALDLEPENPAFLNDAAVVLDYNLDRDLEKAKEMYAKALRNAQQLLDSGKVPPSDLELVRTARRDSENNLARLEKRMAKKREPEEKKAEEGTPKDSREREEPGSGAGQGDRAND